MEKHILCHKDKMEIGDKEIYEIGRTSVVLVRTHSGYYAIRNTCPHQGGPLGKGVLQGAALPSDVGTYCYERKGETIYCPWHHWEFDVTNGLSIRKPESVKVKSYKVEVEGENIVLYA
ncbi:Rieske (2Fe-2S) protein [Bacillus sp. B15-48]|uniref:Rieske (2Fe-2S) protein n=1 Tax=Bacillus sp. B15-48 TaxID=1548601 RepID=UPI00193EF4CE|nr:Rieske (2Fe-2S) protein [Bacillus sp. B15-48]MBM4763683.1 Rieske 2Fe-2S domain-containing protein [Bacillus sp. B15-48]